MNPNLKDRILRKLETLSDERGYQVLDYVEFIESRYAEKPAESGSLFRQFAEGLEDKLRAGRVSATTIADTMGLLNKAVGMLEGVAAAGKSVANDIVTAAQRATGPTGTAAPGAPSGTASGTAGAAGTTPGTTPGTPAGAPPAGPSAAGPSSAAAPGSTPSASAPSTAGTTPSETSPSSAPPSSTGEQST